MSRFFFSCLFLVAVAFAGRPGSAGVIPVDSPAFMFSPGNWTGDAGRGGSAFRQTWVPGAYFRVTWTSVSASPIAAVRFDVADVPPAIRQKALLTYCVDGVWRGNVPLAEEVAIPELKGPGAHALAVYVQTTEQAERWGSAGKSGRNVVRVTGVRTEDGAKPAAARPAARWALIVGDSITEGNAANNGQSDNLAAWSYFVGRGLQRLGFEYGLSACGYSGWLRPGDASHDVPGYYVVSGGRYDEAKSRWNKLDGFGGAGHGLLDAKGRLSAYGQNGQEPGIILINYGTNDGLGKVNATDLQASVAGALEALRRAAPGAWVFVIVPFGQYAVETIQAGVADYRRRYPADRQVSVIDLGPNVARGLAADGYWSGLHPNLRGHATFGSEILTEVLAAMARGTR